MTSRMDKYQENCFQPIKNKQSRFQKNAHLYEETSFNKVLTEFTEIENNNAIDISNPNISDLSNRRERFQRSKQLFLSDIEIKPKKPISENIENDRNLFSDTLEKNYNINDILEEARKHKNIDNELDKKRQLKTVEYSILSDLSKEKLKEYQERKQKLSRDEEENLEELIHTITSNSLKKNIEDELLNDLLPTEESETIISKQLLEEIHLDNSHSLKSEDTNLYQEDDNTYEQIMDNSFYTKSMDLSKEDFDFSDIENDEDISFLKDTKMSIPKKIMIFSFIFMVLVIIGYIIYRFI